MAESRRVYRVAERIREVVAQVLQRAADPRFLMVTISSVIVSKDLQHAKVYWVVSGNREVRIPEVEEAFESAKGLFRRSLAGTLGVRFVPELRFYYDETLDTSERVEKLLAQVRAESAQLEQHTDNVSDGATEE